MRTTASVLALLLAASAGAQAPDAGSPPPTDAGGPTGVLTRAPELKRQVEAPYPPEALARQLEGTVVMLIDISETGAVTDVQVTEPAGHGFDEAAVAAVRQFEFEPAEVDGVPAPVRIQYAYQFVWRAPAPVEGSPEAPVEAPVNFSGRALERGTRKPLAGAEVALPRLEQSTTTDAEGRFSFRGVPLGSHEVLVVLGGYERFRTQESFNEGQQTQATYYVRKRIFSPYETVVRSERERKEVTRTTLQAAEIQKVPGTQGDTLKVVQNLPGVARPAFNGGQIVIRGTSPNDSGIFLDGQRIPLLYHFGGLTSVYNSELLDSLDYLPGNFSAYYGNVTGGVINVRSRAPKMDGFHGTVGVSLIESNAVLEGPLTENLGIAVAGRRSYIDLVLKAIPENEDGPSIQVAPRYYDAQLKLHWTPHKQHTFTLQGLISNDVLGLVFDRPADDDPSINGAFEITTGFKQLRLGHQYKAGRFNLDSQVLVGNTLIEFIVGDRNLRISSLDLGLRSTAEYAVAEPLTVAGGLDIDFARADVRARLQSLPREGEPPAPLLLEEILTVDGNFLQYFPGMWAELRWKPVKDLLVVPGLRSESYVFENQEVRKRSLNPRLAVRYALTDTVTLKGGAGIYHSPPSQDEPSITFGNPELKAKRSKQYSVGSEWQPTPEYFLSGELFYNDLSRLIVRSDRQVERDGQQVPERLSNQGTGRILGFEVLARRVLTERFFGWVSYTFSRSQRRDRPGERLRLFDNDQTHVLTAIASYKLPAGWELGARMRVASGNPLTPVTGAVRDDGTDVFIPTFGPVNSERLPTFHQLDIRVDKNFVFEQWNLNVYLDLTNAYNHPAKEGILYNYNYTESAFLKGLPLLPILGAKGSF
ncbi:TonB-dependent receptor [Stigmatella aurantiaca]|uniref:TonB family C-terminal domain protein n=1 Tax=Stigmatella aurantiaca (strain DW4/3-1) TaxID=378806 RepID=Q09AN4_STIAD|nr:TonB-dependent receptor [Stigmatella aurantiaca]ADO74884.1 TonB family protein [Stigmatella aurantiaca DW4/3-1]EAU68840.1 TonB family C-terminal domain protein [Stigmatella aurantiaca DW4/3-1]